MNFLEDILANWLDKNKLVKPQASWTDSGNGIFYTSIALLMSEELSPSKDLAWFKEPISKCFFKPGVLMRTPDNAYGQEQFDDYLGLVAALITIEESAQARAILWHGLTHLFFFDCDSKFEWKDFLGRYVHLWLLYWCAGFRFLRYPLYPLLALAQHFLPVEPNDPGGLQLTWVYLFACKELGFRFAKYDQVLAELPAALEKYYGAPQPFTAASKLLK